MIENSKVLSKKSYRNKIVVAIIVTILVVFILYRPLYYLVASLILFKAFDLYRLPW